MKRLVAIAAAACLVATGCNRVDYPKILRARLTSSGNLARSFDYTTVSRNQSYTVTGRVEDDLRYAMVLSSQGKPLIDYVVRDDALSVRLRDPAFGKRLANTLGDSVVDAALKQGRWVTDPTGAPGLIRTDTGGSKDTTGNPFQDARDLLDFVVEALVAARDVKLFTLDDVEYRSALDPWAYPNKDKREVRYDLRRPFLPLSPAGAGARGAQGSVGPPQFRKTSVYVDKGKVERVCSLIDIEGHEEFIALRQRGLNSNPFLRDLLRQIEKGENPIPIEPRYIVADLSYPSKVSVGIPSNAILGKLETFQSALTQAVGSGVLRPTENVDTSKCRRRETKQEG